MRSSTKIMLAIGVMAIACIGLFMVENDADESDAADTVTITVTAGTGGTATGGGTYSLGDTVTLRATPNSGYRFVNWTFAGGTTQTLNPWSYEVTSVMLGQSVSYTANFERTSSPTTYTVSFAESPSGYGTVSRYAISSVPSGSSIQVNGSTVTINGISVTATPAATSGGYTYSFTGWSNTSGTITANRTIWANFAREAATTTVTVTSSGNGTATGGGTFGLGDTVTLTATPDTNYHFTNWTSSGPGGSATHQGNPLTYEVTSQMLGTNVTFTANFAEDSSTSVTVLSSGHGTATGGGIFYLGDTVTLTATPDSGYEFANWTSSGPGGSATHQGNPLTYEVTSEMLGISVTFTANFRERTVIPTDVYWSNDMYNGSVSIAFRFSGGSNNMDHHMSIPLYIGETNERQETEWTDTGKELQLTITYPSTRVVLEITDGSTTLLGPTTINVGMWKAFVLTLNTDRGQMTFTPIDVFTNFTDYTTLDDKTKLLADWSSITKGNTIHEIIHTETGTGAPVSMQVVNTDTFLNTFGVVLTNPSINVFDYFPDLTSARLNFYAFALYGDSMTINGTTLPVDDTGKVQVTYTSNSRDTEHWIASPGTEGAKTSSFTLSNIYITWQDGNVSLTFVDDRFTVDLGAYSAGDESVSFTGYWYFTTMLNEPYQTTEKVITGDWHTLPTIGGPAMLLVFLGVILIGGMIAHVKIGLKWLDFVILGMGLIVTFTLLG